MEEPNFYNWMIIYEDETTGSRWGHTVEEVLNTLNFNDRQLVHSIIRMGLVKN